MFSYLPFVRSLQQETTDGMQNMFSFFLILCQSLILSNTRHKTTCDIKYLKIYHSN